jgi:hypothetical protein
MMEASPTVQAIARVCHEANRAWCQALGDETKPPWDEAPDWQRESACNGVAFYMANPDAGPEASHEEWFEEKRQAGWRYGPKKDPERREHPSFRPFDQLPLEEQARDHLFHGIVHAFMHVGISAR